MNKSTIYLVGYGNKKIDDFINNLINLKIDFLLDIRSAPYSKWHDQYKHTRLAIELERNNITYVFMGDTLSESSDIKNWYYYHDLYDLIKEKSYFRNGLNNSTVADSSKMNIAILCNEQIQGFGDSDCTFPF